MLLEQVNVKPMLKKKNQIELKKLYYRLKRIEKKLKKFMRGRNWLELLKRLLLRRLLSRMLLLVLAPSRRLGYPSEGVRLDSLVSRQANENRSMSVVHCPELL
jgi:hypothetical protein